MCGIRSVDCVLEEHLEVLGMSCLVGESSCLVPQVTPVNLCFYVVHNSDLKLEGKPRAA